MIFDAIIGALISLAAGVLGLFPAYELPASVTDLADTLGSWTATANRFFPMDTLSVAIAAVLGARVFVFLVRVVVWVWDLVPFKAT